MIWDDAARFTVEPGMIRHRHKVTPYAGRTLEGVVERTFLRGRAAYTREGGLARPAGELLEVRR